MLGHCPQCGAWLRAQLVPFEGATGGAEIMTRSADHVPIPLSAREIEVLRHVADGRSNKLIGRGLAISEQTVKNHITTILRKLGARDRTHAVVIAASVGFLRLDEPETTL